MERRTGPRPARRRTARRWRGAPGAQRPGAGQGEAGRDRRPGRQLPPAALPLEPVRAGGPRPGRRACRP
ncbi:MAG TPA: hypothetical protein DCS97_06615 [Planctomycetes bacterium]|nr:hypothetical protein [Planctomycetota bacterium]